MFQQRSKVWISVAAAASSFLIYRVWFGQSTIETVRKQKVSKRKLLTSPQEKYASLKVTTS